MADYRRPDEMSAEQKAWLALCKEALKQAPESVEAEAAIAAGAVRASVEIAPGDRINVRLRSAEDNRLLCLARFRSAGQLQTLLDKSKEPWEEFLFPHPG